MLGPGAELGRDRSSARECNRETAMPYAPPAAGELVAGTLRQRLTWAAAASP
jgi:hypothetical protein